MTRLLIAVLLALTIIPALPGDGMARQDDLDCRAFENVEEANAYYAEHPEAQDAIDDDSDGEACEVYFGLEARDDLPVAASSAGDAGVTDDLDCEDFSTQEEAQAVLDEDPGDPHNLDPNKDGIACALLPSAADSSVAFAQDADEPNAEETDDRAARRAARQAAREQETGNNQDAGQTQDVALTCNDFFTQEEAQAAYDDDPAGQAALNENGDGVACPDLPSASDQAAEDPQADAADENGTGNQRRNRRNRGQPTEDETVVDTPVTVGKEDLDCIDFEFQEDAQAIYNRDPSDPFNLDPNADGFACSSLPSRDPQISQVPRTGAGNAAAAIETWLLAGAGLAGLAALGARRTASRRSTQ